MTFNDYIKDIFSTFMAQFCDYFSNTSSFKCNWLLFRFVLMIATASCWKKTFDSVIRTRERYSKSELYEHDVNYRICYYLTICVFSIGSCFCLYSIYLNSRWKIVKTMLNSQNAVQYLIENVRQYIRERSKKSAHVRFNYN